VDQVADEIIVDAIQLSPDPRTEPGALLTLAFLPDRDDLRDPETLVAQLERWAVSHDGVCDAYIPQARPIQHIAIFQGSDLLMLLAPQPGT
jgi:hypothetical protein